MERLGQAQTFFDRARRDQTAGRETGVRGFLKQFLDHFGVGRVTLIQCVKHQFHRVDKAARDMGQQTVGLGPAQFNPREQVDQGHGQLGRRVHLVMTAGVIGQTHQPVKATEIARTVIAARTDVVQHVADLAQRVKDVIRTPRRQNGTGQGFDRHAALG